MTRVSENSSTASLKYSLNRTKGKMEDLQLKGSTLRNISKPSDNPVSNVEALSLTSLANDNKQYLKNADFALLNLSVTEKSIEELTDILNKAKEIAISQSSDFYNADVRKNVANEINQLYNQALSIANKKVGLKHIFAGFDTLKPPFDHFGNYHGDQGHISLEVSRNFFVPINLHGDEVFYSEKVSEIATDPTKEILENNLKQSPSLEINRDLASQTINADQDGFEKRDNIFSELRALSTALENNDAKMIQGLLEKFDSSINRLITLRTRVGSLVNSVESSQSVTEKENIEHITRRSNLLDADVTELFSDITKQQAILKTTYQSSQGLMNQTLMDYLRR